MTDQWDFFRDQIATSLNLRHFTMGTELSPNTPWGTAYGHIGATSNYNAALFHFPESGATLSYVGTGLDLERLDVLNEVALEIREGFMALTHEW